jgi:16S rRNA (cytosine967-C5)-methyltransferase
LSGVLRDHRSIADQLPPLAVLPAQDRARAQSLATTTIRHLGRIDAVLDRYLTRRPPAPALDALRIATAEMRLDGVPPYAAVDGAVRLATAAPKGRSLAGLVNAVARRVADAPALWEETPEAPLPDWLAHPLATAWGADTAKRIAEAGRSSPPLDLTPRDPAEAAALAAELGAELLPTGSLRLAGRFQVSALPGYDGGGWWVQDAAAALPVRLLGDVGGRRVLDLCAAPGGKTLQLAAGGAQVTALDISEARLVRLRENLGRTGLSAETIAADALNWEPAGPFDVILLDAPCTASGTLRRHPDIAYLHREPGPFVALQSALLARAWGWLAPGGSLVFCTCSLFPDEGERQIAGFLAAHPEAEILPADAPGLDVQWIAADGGLRLRPDYWPDRGGMDGFYAARLVKPR